MAHSCPRHPLAMQELCFQVPCGTLSWGSQLSGVTPDLSPVTFFMVLTLLNIIWACICELTPPPTPLLPDGREPPPCFLASSSSRASWAPLLLAPRCCPSLGNLVIRPEHG